MLAFQGTEVNSKADSFGFLRRKENKINYFNMKEREYRSTDSDKALLK